MQTDSPFTERPGTTLVPVFLWGTLIAMALLFFFGINYVRSQKYQQIASSEEELRVGQRVRNSLTDSKRQGIIEESERTRTLPILKEAPDKRASLNPDTFQDSTPQTAPIDDAQARASKITVYSAGPIPQPGQSIKFSKRKGIRKTARSNYDGRELQEDDQGRKLGFLHKPTGNFVHVARKQSPAKGFVLSVGTLIPALMKEAINSDLPGELRAQVSQAVYDSPSGEHLLIPQGATLFGRYDSRVAYGQSRVLVAWHLITYPDGSTLELKSMQGSDAGGAAGFSDSVNNHYWRIFGSATLLSVISAGVQLSQPQNSALQNQSAGSVAAGALGQTMGSVGTNLLQRNLNIQPTLEIRPGYRFNVKVNKELRFEESYS